MKPKYGLKSKILRLLVISIFAFSSAITAQVSPVDENFNGFGGANNIPSVILDFPNNGKHLTLSTILPLVTPASATRAFLGRPGAALFPVTNAGLGGADRAFVFNYTDAGTIPGSGLSGSGDYRIKFSTSGTDTSTAAGNFWLKSMYVAIGNGNTATITIQGFRAGKIVGSGTVTFNQGTPSSSSSSTDIGYSTSIDGQAGLQLDFGTNWTFLDGVRITTTNTDIPVLIDNLDFEDPSPIAPTTRASSIGFTPTGITSGISWANGSGDATAVFVKAGNSGSPSFPLGGTVSHTSNTAFGSGTEAGTGWFCVFKGTGTSTTITNLTPGTTYRAIAVSYNGATGYETHITTEGTNINNFTTIAIPSTQASSVNVSNITGTTASLSWSSGNGARRAVFVKLTNTGTAAPDNNTNYTASTNVTAGSQAGSGWRCVFNGTGASVNITNLTAGQTYRAVVMEYNDNGQGSAFNTFNINAATGNPVNFIMDDVPVVTSSAATSITHNGAVLNGSINDMGDNTTVSFQYATNSSLTVPSTIAGSPLTVTAGGGATTVSSTLSGLTPSTTYYFRARGVNAVGATNGSSILSFITAPIINNVTTLSANGSYKAGQLISIRVTFTSAVTVTGIPQLALNTGGIATYLSGSTTSTITFSYTIGAGENVNDLDYTSVSALALAGGTIRDASNTDANLTLPAPGATGSLGANKDIIVDTQGPSLNTVTIVSNNVNTALAKTGDLITVAFTSNETINTPTVTIAGNAATVSNAGGNNWTATYAMTGADATGIVAFDIAFSDLANNNGTSVTATTNSSSISFDKTNPVLTTVTIASNNVNTALAKVGDVVTLNFTSSETINAPSATIAGNAATVSNVSGNNWKAVYTMVAGDATGVVPFAISFSDLVGNAGTTVTVATNSSSVSFDKAIPTLTTVTIASNNANTALAKTGDVITLNFTSSETINTLSATIAGNAATVSNVSGNNWKAVYAMAVSDAGGVIPFSISFNDLVGNAGAAVTATTNSSTVNFDKTNPTLTTVIVASNNANTAMAKTGDVITLNFTSSETINTPSATIAGNVATVNNVSGNNWKAVYAMAVSDAGGVIPFSISFNDLVGNAGAAVTATTNSSTVNFDKTNPTLITVTIASNNANTAMAKVGDIITLNFTSSETINTLSATIAGNAAMVSNVSGNNWKAVYTITAADAGGVIPFSISFSDLAGNVGAAVTATTNSSTVSFDKTNPTLTTVTIASNNANTVMAKTGDIITLNFTSSETINTPSAIIAGNTATVSNVSGNNWKAVYTMATTDANGIVSFGISFSDLSGNTGTAVTATTNSSAVSFDKTNPTLTTVTIASNNANTALAKTGDIITLNFTSSETINTLSATIAGNAATVSNVSGNNWKAVYTITAADAGGVIPFSISFSDLAGNAGTAVTATTNSSTVSFDKTNPTLTTVTIVSNNANTAFAKLGDVITLNFTSSETINTPSATIAGNTATVSNVSGNNWKAVYTMTSSDASGTVPFSISFTDITGNTGTPVTATTNSSSVVYDKTAPAVSSINRQVPLTQDFSGSTSVTYRVSFSEAVKNVTAASFQFTQLSGNVSGTIASVSAGTGTVIDVTINGITGNGSFRMDLKNSSGITDNAGNAISGFANGQSYGNNTAPVITAGATQSLAICQGVTTTTSIDNMLAATDVDNGQTLTWTIQSGPSHGTLSGFPATVTVVNGSLVPSGLTYIADVNYSGADVFVIQVSDGLLSVTTTVNITINPLPVVALTAPQGTIICGAGGSVNIDAVSGNTYTWYRDGIAINGVSAAQLTVNSIGTYTATATSAAGCIANTSNSIVITQLQKPTVDFSFDSYCINNPVSFTNKSVTTNSGPVTYLWTNGNGNTSTLASPVFTYTQAGSYTVKLKVTPNNCPAIADSISKTIQIEIPVAAVRLTTQDIVVNTPAQLTARTLPAAYTWVPKDGLSATNIANPLVTASGEVQYTIAMKVASGCITTDTLLVRVFTKNDIMAANVFTPNGDGVNDKLIVNLVGVKNFHFFRVFNRQGKKIFETTNPFEGWDGRLNGVLQPMDTYVWVAEGSDQNGAIIHKQGSTTLIR